MIAFSYSAVQLGGAMTSYSEIIYLTAALMIFSLLAVNTTRNFNQSRSNIYRSEVEYRAIAVAQDIIDKVQWVNKADELNPNSTSYLYADHPISITERYGPTNKYSDTFTVYANSELLDDTGSMKRYQITVSVLNEELYPEVFVTLDFTKSVSN